MGNIDFTRLTFTVDIWPLKRRELTLFPAERRVVCESGGDCSLHAEHRFSDAEWRKLEELLASCDLAAWQETYERPVLDGEHWQLELRGADGRVRRSEGRNAWPDEWEAFEKFCDFCAGSAGFEPDEPS